MKRNRKYTGGIKRKFSDTLGIDKQMQIAIFLASLLTRGNDKNELSVLFLGVR